MGISLKSGLLELTLDSKDMPLEQLAEILTKYDRKKEILSTAGRFVY